MEQNVSFRVPPWWIPSFICIYAGRWVAHQAMNHLGVAVVIWVILVQQSSCHVDVVTSGWLGLWTCAVAKCAPRLRRGDSIYDGEQSPVLKVQRPRWRQMAGKIPRRYARAPRTNSELWGETSA